MDVNNDLNITVNDLFCPTTLELFRDPVIAGDGHVYEREAITQWILEHGTSPLTRERLQINELQPDFHLRQLANRRRNSTVSYQASENHVTFPVLGRVPHPFTPTTPGMTEIEVGTGFGNRPNLLCFKYLKSRNTAIIIIFTFIVVVSIAVPLGIRANQKLGKCCFVSLQLMILLCCSLIFLLAGPSSSLTSTSTVTTTYQNALTVDSSIYARANGWGTQYYYQAIEVNPLVSGSYTWISMGFCGIYGYIYIDAFDPFEPNTNMMQQAVDYSNYGQLQISAAFKSGRKYILIMTTLDERVQGEFSIDISGSASIVLQFINTSSVLCK